MPRGPRSASETYAILFARDMYTLKEAQAWLRKYRKHALDVVSEGKYWRFHLLPYAEGYRYRYYPLHEGVELLLRFR